MSEQRKKQVCALVIVLGIGAVAIDRLVIGAGATGPTDAMAQYAAPAASSTVGVASGARPAPIPPVEVALTDEKTLPRRMEKLAAERQLSADHMRDAFLAPASWQLVESPKPAPTAAPAGRPAPDQPESPAESAASAFERTYRLSTVLLNNQGGMAIVASTDGASKSRVIIVGQSLDGFTLDRVTATSAVFSQGEQTATLSLPLDAGPSAPDR